MANAFLDFYKTGDSAFTSGGAFNVSHCARLPHFPTRLL